jgi:hypothetical protein
MEIGKYIDFHNTDTSTNDYDVRLQANTSTPCVITLPTADGTLARTADNVASATKLQTARTINGTTFNGTANITTANWGTARTLTIGNKGQSVNGSGNITWSTGDILGNATTLGKDTDWNTANATGIYEASGFDAEGATGANRPVGAYQWGGLLTLRHKNVTNQIYLSHGSNQMWIRGGWNGSFNTSWARVYTTDYKPTYSDVGAAAASHGTHVTYATATPKANGTAAIGSVNRVAREDHVHPLQASAATWTTARTLTIGNKGQSVNGSANVSWSLADIGAVETVAWDTSIKCATWSRLFQYSAANEVIGGAFLVNIQATRGNVVYGPTVLVNFGHASTCNIVQINNISYTNIKIRGVVDSNGAGYLEIYDNANSATNSTTQSVTVSVTKLTKGLSITKYTSFTDGSTIPTNYASKGEITTVSGCYYTGKSATSGSADTASSAGKLTTARTLTIGNTGKSFDGSANVSWTLADIGALPAAGGNVTGNIKVTNDSYLEWNRNTDYARISFKNTGDNDSDSYMYFLAGDNGNEYFKFSSLSGSTTTDLLTIKTDHLRFKGYNVYHTGNKPTPSDLGAAASSHTHNYAGSSSAGGAANSANVLNQNTRMDYGWSGLNYFNISGTAGNAAKVNDTPTTAWWHIIRCNHANSTGYYTDIAVPFNETSMYYKRIANGAVQNSGWVKMLDALNWSDYAAAKSHGTHVSYGGNGSATTVSRSDHSHNFISIKGNDTITSTTDDTTTKWGAQGVSTHFYTKTGQLIDQPNQWGYILNIGQNSEVHQLWMTQASGDMFHRGGNGSGWSGSWRRILDESNFKTHVTSASIGAEVATATHSTVDITSSGFASKGTKTADTMASTGNCYSLASATSSLVLASGNFNAVKFGKYALCLRIKSSNNTSTANILTVTVKHGSTTLLTKNIKGTDFTSTSQYSNIYTSFDFNGTSSARGTLSVQISTGTTSGITFRFDYAYITLMTPSVFI